MSGKIRSKHLAYEAALPPFLQRLRNQNTARGDTDRHERPIARAKLAKDATDDDDGPTVVDESGETMTQKDFEKRAAADSEGTSKDMTKATDEAVDKEPSSRVQQHVTDGTSLKKKRKAVKVIEDDDAADADDTAKSVQKATRKKKAKSIKLAFDDNEEDG